MGKPALPDSPSGRLGRYFKYAIGEILLVVIGILIALQINNWNEARKDINLKNNYLNQLLNDLENDTRAINFQINRITRNMAEYENYLKELEAPNLPIDSILNHLKKVNFTFQPANFNMQTFNVLESTGDLRLFDETLRNNLMALNTAQLSFKETQNTNFGLYGDISKDIYLIFKNDYLKEMTTQKLLYQNLESNHQLPNEIIKLNHALRFKNFSQRNMIMLLNNILNQTEELIALIEESLEQNN
jgi:hypothetical protein